VPSENVATPVPDRRTRKHAARRDHLLDLAADLVERTGVDGLTMAALADAADYAQASLYTYFPSRSALLAALQQRALRTLAEVARDAVASWSGDEPDHLVALARLWAFSDLFLAAPEAHPREFRLQQELLVAGNAEETADAARVVPDAMAVLAVPCDLLAAAARAGALEAPDAATDPVGLPVDGHLLRTLAWVVALNGALLTDRLVTGLPTTGVTLGGLLTGDLLAGWGAAADQLAAARTLADRWRPGHTPVPTPTPGSDRADRTGTTTEEAP
jgi:AcrR family transcriptional regulator